MQLFTLLLHTLSVVGLLGHHVDASPAVLGGPIKTPPGAVMEAREVYQRHGGHGAAPVTNLNVVTSIVVVPTETSSDESTTVVELTATSSEEPTPVLEPTATSSEDPTTTSISSSSYVELTSSILTVTSISSSTRTLSTSSNTKIIITDYTTVQWYQSWVGGTYSTWFPTTIEVHPESLSPAPAPGKGEIGMGTLTGELKGTRTIYAAAAATQTPGWAKGIAVAVGAGVVGVLV